MSSKRGRKRNDNLPPNRARDVQRAFRARRAAHLEALENRVAELEEENAHFRIALNLPPANRPPLGKGPTGKDKPKPFLSSPAATTASASAVLAVRNEAPTPLSFDQTSSNGSPSSSSVGGVRTHSLSPGCSGIGNGLSMRPSTSSTQLDGSTSSWADQPLLLDSTVAQSPPSTGYPLANVATHRPSSAYGGYPSPSPQRPLSAASSHMYTTAVTSLPTSHAFDGRASYIESPYPYREETHAYAYGNLFQSDPFPPSNGMLQRDPSYARRPMTADAQFYSGNSAATKQAYVLPPPQVSATPRFHRLSPPRPPAFGES